MERLTRPWVDDPEPGDMDDLEYREEMFEIFKHDDTPPENITDPKLRADYEEWLKKPHIEKD